MQNINMINNDNSFQVPRIFSSSDDFFRFVSFGLGLHLKHAPGWKNGLK